jgi:hypothetical protein
MIKKRLINEDILFLKACKRQNVFPKCVDSVVKSCTKSVKVQKIVKNTKLKVLTWEIRKKYIKLDGVEKELYCLKLSLLKEMGQMSLECVEEKINLAVKKRLREKVDRLCKKFNVLVRKSDVAGESEKEEEKRDFIINKACVELGEEEKEVLNKGLNYQPRPKVPPLDEIVVALESTIKDLPIEKKMAIRNDMRTLLEKEQKVKHKKIESEWRAIESLKKRNDLVFLEPDKGKGIVIMKREDYELAMQEHLDTGPYELVKCRSKFPVDTLQRSVKLKLKELHENGLINDYERKVLSLPNPSIPQIYALPKIHKPGNKVRPVVSSCNSPISKICEFLLIKMKKWKKPWSCSIKNSSEAAEILRKLELEEGEKLASFDVVSLYPSIPINDAFLAFEEHAQRQTVDEKERTLCVELMKLILSQRWIEFNGTIYKQLEGLFIGNALSPLLAEIFMGKLESEMHQLKWFPRFYIRYVDDVVAVVKDNEKELLEELNKRHPAIKFTVEYESDNKLPFLDLMLHREKKRVTIDIYRKPTDAPLCINNSSSHSKLHKLAAFEFAIFRLWNLPLNRQRRDKEMKYILDMAKINGYEREDIIDLYYKHKRKSHLKSITTLSRAEKKRKSVRNKSGREVNKFIKVPYFKPVTQGLRNVCHKHGINIVYKNDKTLKSLIGRVKSKKEDGQKSGVYEISCENCEDVYIGQTIRRFETRDKEHSEAIKNNMLSKSSVADHCYNNRHKRGDGKLIKSVNDPHLLDAWESLYINTRDNLMNNGEPPIVSTLFTFAKTRGRQSL